MAVTQTAAEITAAKIVVIEAKIENLQDAIDAGARTVIHDGKQIHYRSRAEMLATLRSLVKRHRRLSGVTERSQIKRWRFQNGL
tara:strand:+ start:253 stop:504 length:252 start_codon:yes stop_codon:yes gene_type:complete